MVSSARKIVKSRDKDSRLGISTRRRSLRSSGGAAILSKSSPSKPTPLTSPRKHPTTTSTTSTASTTGTKPTSAAATTSQRWDDKTYKLFLTTRTRVCVWDAGFLSTIFTSHSSGILAAKRSKDGSILAVADAQIVVLHKVEQGQHQSYRLKGYDFSSEEEGGGGRGGGNGAGGGGNTNGNNRLLQYAHDSRSLFFTDNIHNSVQTYSLKEDRVSEAEAGAAQRGGHPSRITAFCVSMDSNLILSCSADPPVIHLHNRQLGTTVDIKPKASEKPVVCCAFHPSRKNTFLLAFGDGVVAAYDSTRLIRGEAARKAARKGNVGSGGGEHIHSFGHLHDASVSGGAGITGVQFVPGYRARAVSVGEDGRLFIVDFEKRDVLGSWHVGAPASCLALREAVGKDAGRSAGAGGGAGAGKDTVGWMAAVGTIHGRCFVFDGEGRKVCEQVVDADGGRVLDVEWVLGDVCVPPGISGAVGGGTATGLGDSASVENGGKSSNATTRYPETLSSNKTAGIAAGEISDVESTSGSALARLPTNPPLLPEIPKDSHWQDVVETYTAGYMKLFSPVKKRRPTKAMSVPEKSPTGGGIGGSDRVNDPRERVAKQDDQRSAISAPLLWDEKPLAPKAGPSAQATDVDTGSTTGGGGGSGGRIAGGLFDGPAGSTTQPSTGNVSLDKLTTTTSKESIFDTITISDNPQKEELRQPIVQGKANTSATSLINKPTPQQSPPAAANTSVTDHAKILSDIRSIRGESDRGSRQPRGLALFAPYMPTRPGAQKSLLKGASGAGMVGNTSIASVDAGHDQSMISEGQASTIILDEETVKDDSFVEGVGDESIGDVTVNSTAALDDGKGGDDGDDSSDEGDIWLALDPDGESEKPKLNKKSSASSTNTMKPSIGKTSAAESLKRKTPLDENRNYNYPRPGANNANNLGPNKARKLSVHEAENNGALALKNVAGAAGNRFSLPSLMGGRAGGVGGNNSTLARGTTPSPFQLSRSGLGSRESLGAIAGGRSSPFGSGGGGTVRFASANSTPLSSSLRRNTGSGSGAVMTGGHGAGGFDEIVRMVREEVRGDVKAMHEDMKRMFVEQRKMFEEFSSEMVGLRAENERLRRELFEIMGRGAGRR